MAKKSVRMSDDKIIREVIKKYGEVINLKETPFVLIEILRNFSSVMDPDGGLPPGGTPPPPPGPETRRIDNSLLLKEILNLRRDIKALQERRGRR